MLAVEIEAPIVNHRLNIFSDRLPAQSRLAKIIVMYSEEKSDAPAQGVLSRLRAHIPPRSKVRACRSNEMIYMTAPVFVDTNIWFYALN
ncbi:MAG: hypothetical protein NTY60_02120 [Proteobacteria bacterium]|nr:hypothetical protein [Pseudomonadota bacterium]